MLIGYSRTSTTDQVAGFEAQKRDLEAAGCAEIFSEQVSAFQKRNELERLLRFIRKGDTLVVTKLDRLARSIPDLVRIVETLESKEATLCILNMNLNTSSPTGRLLLNLLASVAQFEVQIMRERQIEGIAAARAAGKYRGRKPTARSKSDEVFALRDRGVPPSEIADQLKISRASTYRILAAKRAIQDGSKTSES